MALRIGQGGLPGREIAFAVSRLSGPALELGPKVLDLAPLGLEPGEERVQRDVLRSEAVARIGEHVFGDAQPRRDHERVTAAGPVPYETVRRFEPCSIEFQRGVHGSGLLVAEALEVAEVRRGDRETCLSSQPPQRCRRKRAPLGGVRGAADLVEEDDVPVAGLVQNLGQVARLRTEGGERCLDRLFVPDDREEATEEGDPAPVAERRQNPALRERGQQAERLEEHRLPPRVRARNEEDALARREIEVERDRSAGIEDEKRMTRAADADPLRSSLAEGRGRRVHLAREERAGAKRVQFHEGGVRDGEFGRAGAHGGGEVAQDPVHLAGLAEFQLTDLVHRLDRARWLDEQGPAACGSVVYEAARDPLPLAAYRDAVTAVSDGDRGVGHANAFRQLAGVAREFVDEPAAPRRERATDAPKFRGGPIRDRARRIEGARNPFLELRLSPQPAHMLRREAIGIETRVQSPHGACDRHDLRACEQLRRLQRRVFDREPPEGPVERRDRVQHPTIPALDELPKLVHRRERADRGSRVGKRAEAAYGGAARLRHGAVADRRQHTVELDDPERVIHGGYPGGQRPQNTQSIMSTSRRPLRSCRPPAGPRPPRRRPPPPFRTSVSPGSGKRA